jgi:hypothetical protein
LIFFVTDVLPVLGGGIFEVGRKVAGQSIGLRTGSKFTTERASIYQKPETTRIL